MESRTSVCDLSNQPMYGQAPDGSRLGVVDVAPAGCGPSARAERGGVREVEMSVVKGALP